MLGGGSVAGRGQRRCVALVQALVQTDPLLAQELVHLARVRGRVRIRARVRVRIRVRVRVRGRDRGRGRLNVDPALVPHLHTV